MIRFRSFFAVLSVALLLAASDARAAFTYSVAVTTSPGGPAPAQPATTGGTTAAGVFNNTTFGSSTYFILGQTSPGTLTGSQGINLVQTSQTSNRVGSPNFNTPPTNTDGTNFNVSMAVLITNQPSGASGTITLSGLLTVTRSDTLGASSTFTNTSISPASITLGGVVYTLSGPIYTFPTIGTTPANGGISIQITEGVVPEPASLVMMGTSVLALGGLTVLRRRRQS